MYATSEVPDIVETGMFQIYAYLLTAYARMTNYHRVLFRIEVVECLGDLAHGNQSRVLEMTNVEFPLFAHVDQQGFIARGFHEFVKFNNVDVPHNYDRM